MEESIMETSFRVHLRESSSTLVFLQHVMDCVLVVLILYSINRLYGVPWSEFYTFLALFAFIACFISFYAFHLYRSWRGSDYYKEFGTIAMAWGMVVGLVLLALFVTKTSERFSRVILMAWFFATPLVLFGAHVLVRTALRLARSRGYNQRRAVIVGGGDMMERLCRHLGEMHWAGIQILGYFADQEACGAVSGNPCPLLGKIEELPRFLKAKTVDYVYIALPMKEEEKITQLINRCRTLGANLYMVPDLYTYGLFNARMEYFGNLLLLNFNPEFRLKRYFDVVFSLAVLLFTLPLTLVIALLIKLQDGGPVFYGQKRVTAAGKRFTCWKFRTMCVDADKKLQELLESDPQAREEWEKTFKLKNDPRVTWIGRFLRRTSLDELPQFINVLKGEMSVVGARPIVEKELYDYYGENGGLYCSLKPGITGLWQVSMRSDTVNYQDRVDLDTWYVLNRSAWLDFKIVLKTVWVVLSRKGAC